MKNLYRYSWIFFGWSFFQTPMFFAIDLAHNDNLVAHTSIVKKTTAQKHIEDITLQTLGKIQENYSDEQLQEITLQLMQTMSEYLNLTIEEVATLDGIVNNSLKNYTTEPFSLWIQNFSQTIIDFTNAIFQKKLVTESDYKVATLSQLTSHQLKNKEIIIIVDQLTKLSQRSRPKNIQTALKRMQQGQIVRRAIKSGNFNSLISHSSLNHQEYKLFQDLLTHKQKPEDIARELSSESLHKIRDAYLTLILDLQWYFFKKIMLQKEGFFSGSVSVYDHDEKIMHFLENYVRFMNKDFNISGLTITSMSNNQAYNRSDASTHWWGKVARFPDTGIERIYGIDVRFNEAYNDYLPNNKNQLHFAYLDNGHIFVKWEKYGTTLNLFDQSEFWHLACALKNIYERFSGFETSGFRDENQIPENVLTQFYKLIDDHAIYLTWQQRSQLRVQGIAGMRDILSQHAPFIALMFDNFLIHQKGYDSATLSYRKGNEVILHDHQHQDIV